MKKSRFHKLQLRGEIVRQLDRIELPAVVGGLPTSYTRATCPITPDAIPTTHTQKRCPSDVIC
jgi:hypothetical protein